MVNSLPNALIPWPTSLIQKVLNSLYASNLRLLIYKIFRNVIRRFHNSIILLEIKKIIGGGNTNEIVTESVRNDKYQRESCFVNGGVGWGGQSQQKHLFLFPQ